MTRIWRALAYLAEMQRNRAYKRIWNWQRDAANGWSASIERFARANNSYVYWHDKTNALRARTGTEPLIFDTSIKELVRPYIMRNFINSL